MKHDPEGSNMNYLKVVILCLVLLSMLTVVRMTGCSHDDTALVTIHIERRIDAIHSYSNSVFDSIFTLFFPNAYATTWGWSLAYDSVALTVTGEGMADINAAIPPGSTTFTTEVPSGTNRKITVIAYNGTVRNAGKSVITDLGSGEEVTIQMKLLPITIVTSLSSSTGTMYVSFESVEIATGYNIYRSDTADGPYTKVGTKAQVASEFITFDDTPIIDGKMYYYKVSMYNNDGEGEQSNYKETVF